MKKFVLIAVMLLTQACAFTDATLQVEHDDEADITGPISEAGSIVFSVPQLEDARLDKARIGWKKNGFGANTADITTEQPVDVIVENAILDAIKDNGHTVAENNQVRITGTVDRFWFDTDVNFWSIEFIGEIQCTLELFYSETNAPIYSEIYSGTYKEKTAADSGKTWSEVMGQSRDIIL